MNFFPLAHTQCEFHIHNVNYNIFLSAHFPSVSKVEHKDLLIIHKTALFHFCPYKNEYFSMYWQWLFLLLLSRPKKRIKRCKEWKRKVEWHTTITGFGCLNKRMTSKLCTTIEKKKNKNLINGSKERNWPIHLLLRFTSISLHSFRNE